MDGEAIGLLHPGAMGAAVGAELVRAGRLVAWASEGRSAATRARAEAAGLAEVGSVRELAERCSVVLSVCPPHAALEVARGVAGSGATFVDANAVAPSTARRVARVVAEGGGAFVDGGIIGAPPAPGRPVHLWLSGPRAADVAELFEGTAVVARVAPGDPFAASALKMCFAAWTKGTFALLLAVRAAARAHGVEEPLLAEWADASPGLAERSRVAAAQAATKGWRWVGEMHEIAETLRAVGVPDGFHEAAATVFERVERSPEAAVDEATLAATVAALLGGRPRFEEEDGPPG